MTSWLRGDFQHVVVNHHVDGKYYIYSGQAINGWLIKVLNEPHYIELTDEILKELSVDEIIYAEYAEPGAMGNAGGIVIYTTKDDKLFCYEANVFKDQVTYKNAVDKLVSNTINYSNTNNPNQNGLFNFFGGGFGNNVFINKEKKLNPFNDYFLFSHNGKNYRIYSTAHGVFDRVAYKLQMKNNPKRKRKLKDYLDQENSEKEQL